jgi:branched-chain amino acid transport system permease protein
MTTRTGTAPGGRNLRSAQQAVRDRIGMDRRIAWGLGLAVLVFVVLLPELFQPASPFLDHCVTALAYVVMALGLNIVVGFAGLLDLGYVAFFAIGAYTAGWFASAFFASAKHGTGIHILTGSAVGLQPGVHFNFILVLIAGVALTALAGTLIGLPTLRLRGDYIAIVTLAFGEIVRVFAVNGPAINLHQVHPLGLVRPFGWLGNPAPLTAGRQGITPIDSPQLPGLSVFNPLNLRPWYWMALVLVLIVLFVNFRLRDSRLGRAWIALREDEVAAASMGVPLVKTKLLAYATGAAFGGIAGAFLASYLNTVNADQFEFSFSIFVLAMVILGGIGSIWGVTLGAIVLSFINVWLIPDVLHSWPHKIGLNFDLTELSFGIFGFLLVIMMVLRPEGLIPERRRRMELTEGVGTDEALYEVRA